MWELLHLSSFSLNFVIIFITALILFHRIPDCDHVYWVMLVFSGIFCFLFMPCVVQLVIFVLFLIL